jgi:hypothetical protein
MQVICASDNGVVKLCSLEDFDSYGSPAKVRVVRTWGNPNKTHEIDNVAWFDQIQENKLRENQTKIVIALKSGDIRILDLGTGEITKNFTGITHRIKGLDIVDKYGPTKIFACETKAQLSMWAVDCDGSAPSRSNILIDHYQKGTTKQRIDLTACKLDVDQKQLAVTALGWPLCVWDLGRVFEGVQSPNEALIWIAKNLPHDKKLKQPVPWSDTDLVWSSHPTVLFVTTRTGHLRVFDIRAQRRPVSNYHLVVHRADTSGGPDVIAQGHDVSLTHIRLPPAPIGEVPPRGVVTDPLANLWEFDRRGTLKAPKDAVKSSAHSTPLQVVHRYRGVSGAIRDVAYHPNSEMPFLAACGFDRYLHVWHTHTYRHHGVYLKLRWNRLLIGSWRPSSPQRTNDPDTPEHSSLRYQRINDAPKESEDVDSDSEEELLWRSLRTIEDATQCKRKKIDSDRNQTKKKQKFASENTNIHFAAVTIPRATANTSDPKK